MSIIQVNNLKKTFGTNEVLQGIDLTIAKSEVVVIMGPSGSGKSTLLRCLNFLEEPTEGIIRIGDFQVVCRWQFKSQTKKRNKRTKKDNRVRISIVQSISA